MMDQREAVQRLGLAVALLPLGTANDFACTAGISVVSWEGCGASCIWFVICCLLVVR
jgi:hypothetical protein